MLRNFGIVGLLGLFLIPLGLLLIWRARHEILYWLAFFFSTFRKSVQRAASSAAPGPAPAFERPERERREILPLLMGIGLVIFGQILFVLDLVF